MSIPSEHLKQSQQLEQLSDHAAIHVYPVTPALSASQQAQLEEGLSQLMQGFIDEQVIAASYTGVCLDGSAILIAYENCENDSCGGADLSGCRKGKITAVLTQFEQLYSVDILAAPPMLIQHKDQWTCFNRGTLKPLVQAGDINGESLACNARCENLGQWRTDSIAAIKDMWLAPIIQRMQA